MKKRLLFGTTNQTKLERFQNIFQSLNLEIVGPKDFGISIAVKEDGKTPEENAVKKATAYFDITKIPTFAIDYGLYLDKFPPAEQPELFVRRIPGFGREATDDELLEYFVEKLNKVGGESKARWISAIALVTSSGRVFSESFFHESIFTSKVCPIRKPGEPLSSIQIDPHFQKYHAELTPEERKIAQGYRERDYLNFMKKYYHQP